MFVKEFKDLKKGYYLIKGKVKSDKEICNAKVIVISGEKEESFILPVSKGGNINHIIKLKNDAKTLRIEIPLSPNSKLLEDVFVKRLNFFERLYRFYRRTLPLIFSKNPITKKLRELAGLSIAEILLKPEYSYYKTSLARHIRICASFDYRDWLKIYKDKEKAYLNKLSKRSNISFLVIVLYSNPMGETLQRTLDSLATQSYSKFSIYLSQNTNLEDAFNKYSVDYVIFLEEGDVLEENALLCFAKYAESCGFPEIIYSDNDYFSESGEREEPQFKPSWSPDYFLEYDYIQSPVAFKKELLEDIKEFSSNYELILTLLENKKDLRIAHIPALLLTKGKKETPEDSKRKLEAVKKYLKDRASVEEGLSPNTRKVVWVLERFPKVSIIIPTKDSFELISRCVESLKITNYPDYEVIIVDNGSTDERVKAFYNELLNDSRFKILHINQPFNFSKLVNFGLRNSIGEIVCLLNNDTEIVEENWLLEMVRHAMRKEVGVVGAKLLYPDRTIQHGGVILGVFKGADHAFKGFPGDSEGYMKRLITVQNYLAVTAACMVFRKSVFEEVGGFDETLRVNFNDVDFCLRVFEKGYRIVWTPYARVIHLESATRKKDQALVSEELNILRKRWRKYIERDPFYNPNLTIYKTDFSLNGEISFHCVE